MGKCISKQNKMGSSKPKKDKKSSKHNKVEIEESSQNNCKTVTNTCEEENSKEIPHKFQNKISDEDASNEVIKVSEKEKNGVFEENENKYENKSDENKYGNKSDVDRHDENKYENKSDENKYEKKSDVDKSEENKYDENKSVENKSENITTRVTSENTKTKIRESRATYFASFHETEPNRYQIITQKPLGFANPKGYCYLNSVVQVLGSCEDFKKDIYNYKWISSQETNDSMFVGGLFNLIKAIRECNKQNLNKSLDIVQQNITESSFGDDVYKCFMNLLTRVSNVIKTDIEKSKDHITSLQNTVSEKAETNFTRFKKRNPEFVFDNFYGQLTFQTVCKLCDYVCNESFQMIKSLPLPVPNSNNSETLNSCVDLFFNESDVEVDEPMTCECKTGKTISLKSISKLTHGPKYLFIYLNRGSYTDDGVKNDTNVTCDNLTIDIKTLENESIKYDLISVIDHIGDSAYGHYYCKCSFESEQWWLLNDSQVDRIENENDIVTKNTIVFLFKKKQQSNL